MADDRQPQKGAGTVRPRQSETDRATRGAADADRLSRKPGFRPGSARAPADPDGQNDGARSEEHTSELQSLMRISSAVFCLKKKKRKHKHKNISTQDYTAQPQHS